MIGPVSYTLGHGDGDTRRPNAARSRDSDKFSTLVGALGSGTGLFVWILMKMKMMAVGAVGNRARAVFQAPVGALCASMGAAASTAPALAVGTAFG